MFGHRIAVLGTCLLLSSAVWWSCRATSGSSLAGSTFTTRLTAEEAAQAPRTAGMWEVSFAEDGGFTVTHDGEGVVQGRYTVEGNRLTFTDESGPLACDQPAAYEWSLSGSELTMTRVEDACEGRAGVLSAHPLTKP